MPRSRTTASPSPDLAPTAAAEPAGRGSQPLAKLKWVLALLLLCGVGVLVYRRGLVFHWRDLTDTFAHLSIPPLLGGLAAIYVAFVLRAPRWFLLLSAEVAPSPTQNGAFSTFAPQVIGFTATALFGRIADLVRPWLIARRLQTSLATQLAVYSVERVLDLAAAALIIASPLLFSARSSAHHAAIVRTSALAAVAVLGLAVAVLAMRLSGERLPATLGRLLARFSPSLSRKAAAAVRDFQAILHGLRPARLLAASGISLLMWAAIALTYTLCARACGSSPALALLTFGATMPILATSLGGSLLQLPVLGWLTQVGLLAAALHATTGVPLEPATACGVLIVCVTTLSVIPAGLVAAHLSGIRLRDVSAESHARG